MLAALFLVFVNGVFVTAEFALTRLRETQVAEMVREGRPGANLVREAAGSLDAYLAVCQVGITVATLGLGALGEPAIATIVEPALGAFLPEGAVGTISFTIAFVIATFFQVTYGELASKSFAIARPESSALLVAPLMKFFYYLFFPAVWLFNGTANFSVGLFGIPPPSETEERHSEEELHMLVSRSSQQGYLEAEEASRVRAAFDLDEKSAREVMVPRPEVVALPASMKLEELFSVAAEGNDVRYPICEDERTERILGTIHAKDVLRAIKTHGDPRADVSARDIMHDVLTVPENRRVDGILDDLQERGLQMAVVVDEWGAFEGVITIEDILEEIVGDIRDEWEEDHGPEVSRLEEDVYDVKGSTPLRNVNEALGSDFHSEDFGTIGGLVLGCLGRAPEVGDEVAADGYALRVEVTDGARVSRVRARRAEKQDLENA